MNNINDSVEQALSTLQPIATPTFMDSLFGKIIVITLCILGALSYCIMIAVCYNILDRNKMSYNNYWYLTRRNKEIKDLLYLKRSSKWFFISLWISIIWPITLLVSVLINQVAPFIVNKLDELFDSGKIIKY